MPAILKRPLWHFYVTGVVILALSGWLWWAKVYTAPTHVFWSMLNNSLATKSFVMEIDQTAGEDSLRQLIHADLRAAQAHSLTRLKQEGTEVKTEIIGTPSVDYTRYTSIASDQKDASGKPADTSKVLNVWSRSEGTAQTETSGSGHQLYAQAVLGIGLPVGSMPVPMAGFGSRDRETLMERIRSENIYRPDFATVKKERKDGRLIFTYETTIQTILYVRLMQVVAQHLGLSELDQVDANTYSNAATIRLKLGVDALSHQLVSVDSGQGFTQKYTAYNVPIKVQVPSNPISAAELQRRLDEIQKQ